MAAVDPWAPPPRAGAFEAWASPAALLKLVAQKPVGAGGRLEVAGLSPCHLPILCVALMRGCGFAARLVASYDAGTFDLGAWLGRCLREG